MRTSFQSIFALCGATSLSIFYFGTTGAVADAQGLSPATGYESPQQFALGLRDQLVNVDLYSLHADVTVLLHEQIDPRVTVGESIMGSYEFHCDGDKWRKRSYLDSQHYPGMNTDIAYDGEVYQYCTPEDGRVALSFDGGDERAIGVSLPNPILALNQYMTAREVLEDLDQTPSVQRAVASGANLSDLQWKAGDEPSSVRGALPAKPGGASVTNVLVLADDAQSPVRIERMVGSSLMQRTVFSEWDDRVDQDGEVSTWPTSIRFESYHPGSGDLVGSIEMKITEFSVTENTRPFLINLDEMESVWVDQTERFVK